MIAHIPLPPPMAASALALIPSLLFALLFCFFSGVVSVQSSDFQQLLSFRSSLPNPDVLPSWHPSGDPCSSFSGVTCGSSSRVVSIRLDSVLLNADVRNVFSFLLPMDGLEFLSLRAANLTGSLSPAQAGGLRCGGRLAELDLSGNGLRGALSDIPFLTSSCSDLRSLNLSGNSLGGGGGGGGFFPVDAGHRLSLETLDLSNNKISSSSALGWLFPSAADIRHLDLSGNALAGAVPAIANCSALRHLDLASNTLSDISTGAFSSCYNLEFLNLSSNRLAGEFPAGLFGTCRGLLQLDMSYNAFSGKLPSDISTCSALESINLSNNNFSGDLPVPILTSMPGLRRIELGFNFFTGKLLDSLSETPNVELLDLSSNTLSGPIPPELCRGVAGLKELYLQSNKLTGSIPASISNCSTLVSLDMSFNYLTGKIPPSIGSLTSLHDLILWQNMLEGEIPGELGSLAVLENLILDNNALSGPIPDGLQNCTRLNWISLSSNSLSGSIPPWIGKLSNLAILKMGNNSLSGPIPPEIGDCKSLIWLDLNSNQLNGTIPPTMSKQSGKIAVGLVTGKRFVYLRNDGSSECHGSGNLLEFAGIRQEQLERVPTRRSCNFTRVYMGNTNPTFKNNGSIIFMDLSYNKLEGEIPRELGDMFYISILNLGHNALSGPIPTEFGRLKFLGILDLSHNSLQGPIPSSIAGCAMLSEIDLSYNNLSGPIPAAGQLGTFPPSKYQNNPELCGFPLPACGSNSSDSEIQHQRSHRRQASLAGSVAMGLLFSLFCIFGLLIIAVESRKRQRKRKEANNNNNNGGNNARDIYIDGRTQSVVLNSAWKFTGTREALSINLSTFENPLRKLTFQDLLEATNGFHNDSLIGSGGFGDVYKAQLKDGSVVAIKKLIHVSGQGDREFTAEMETIGKIKHRNLVPLLGYCKVGEERLLVYEYMKYGSLEDVLHNRRKAGVKLNWAARRKIAVGAARGLAFLHHNCIPHIIHRDMKSSNVLIDDSLEARVSDFGMARLMSAMDTHLSVSTLAGTPGYVPPEYYQSFRCSTKGDVYSYGVVLLELLTGKQPTDSSDFGDNNIVGWVKQHCKLRISDVFDPELVREDPSLELELLEHLKIACACLDDRPLRRPTMLKVMAMFKEIQAGATVDPAVSAVSGSEDGGFGMVEMGSVKECKEEKD